MVDTSAAAESKYVNADLVDKSPSKKAVIVGDAIYETTDYGEKLTVNVEMDGKKKIWRPNKDSAINLNSAFGTDSKKWLGKVISLKVVSVMGKKAVVAEASK